jgi:hypothetical protein
MQAFGQHDAAVDQCAAKTHNDRPASGNEGNEVVRTNRVAENPVPELERVLCLAIGSAALWRRIGLIATTATAAWERPHCSPTSSRDETRVVFRAPKALDPLKQQALRGFVV